MIVYIAERDIDYENTDLLGPAFTLENAQKLCRTAENLEKSGVRLDFAERSAGTWYAKGHSDEYRITTWPTAANAVGDLETK